MTELDLEETSVSKDDIFDQDKYLKLVREDQNDIPTAMANVSSYFAYYGAMGERWAAVAARLDQAADLTEAVVLDTIKSGEKVTDALAKARVEANGEVQVAKKRLRLANEQAALYKVAVRAFDIKSKMLSGRNAARRSEQDTSHSATHQVDNRPDLTAEEKYLAGRRLGARG
jgi:hypothetical protein